MHTLVGRLQAGAGNAAVARLLSRAGESASAAGPPAPVGSPAAPAGAAAVASGPRYTVMIGEERLEGMSAEAAAAALASHLRRLQGAFAGSRETLEFLWDTYKEQWFVGGVIDLLGGPELPTSEIWAYPMTSLAVAHASIGLAESKAQWARKFRESGREDLADQTASLEREAGEALATAARDLDEAAEALREAQDRVEEFVEGTVEAGDRIVTGLRVAVVAGSVASMALGGAGMARAGFGLLKIAAGSGAAGGVYGTGSDLAGQASEVYHDQRKEIDVGQALRRGAIDAVTGFVGSLTGGLLTKAFERAVGGYLSSSVADDVLVELGRQMGLAGPLPRTYLQTGGQRLAAEVLGEMGAAPISATINALVERIAGGGPLPASAEEFVDMVLGEVVEAGALQLALGAVIRRRGTAPGSRPRPGGGESEAGGRSATGSPEAKPDPGLVAQHDEALVQGAAQAEPPAPAVAAPASPSPGGQRRAAAPSRAPSKFTVVSATYSAFPDLGPGQIIEFPGGERVWRNPVDNTIVIESRLGPGPGRQGHEGALPARGEYDVEKILAHYMERAHSQGQGTGFEAPYGIRLAAEIVNQGYQNVGVEEFGRQLAARAEPGTEFTLKTATKTAEDSLRLEWMDYKVEVIRNGRKRDLFSFRLVAEGPSGMPEIQDAWATADPELQQLLDVPDMDGMNARLQTMIAAERQRRGLPAP